MKSRYFAWDNWEAFFCISTERARSDGMGLPSVYHFIGESREVQSFIETYMPLLRPNDSQIYLLNHLKESGRVYNLSFRKEAKFTRHFILLKEQALNIQAMGSDHNLTQLEVDILRK